MKRHLIWLFFLVACGDDRPSTAPTDAGLEMDSATTVEDAGAQLDSAPDAEDTGAGDGSAPLDIAAEIRRAGDAQTELERYQILEALAGSLSDEHPATQDLLSLLPIIDRWANGREKYWTPGEQAMAGEGGYLAGFFALQVWPGADAYPPAVDEASPVYPLWCLYRGRMLIWTAIQSGLLADQAYEEGRDRLRVAQAAFPNNPIIGMYLDEPVPWAAPVAVDPAAPQWANSQRVILHKMLEVIRFWIRERQAPDGQFGGGWGDDVEMWRWWTPLLVGFDDPDIGAAQTLLSENIFQLDRLSGGYSDIVTDVEHSSEDSSDSIHPMLLIAPDSTEWRDRARAIATLMDELWLAQNERGTRQFSSTHFSSETVDDTPAYACDTMYHTRAVGPALRLWQLTGDAEVAAPIRDWLNNWVEVAARGENGKPEGILPAAIGFPSGQVRANGEQWWNPECHFNRATFRFPRAMSMLSQALVQAYLLSDDARYLEPIRFAYLNRDAADGDADEGSLSWALSEIGSQMVTAMAKYRLATGNAQFDAVLRAQGSPYVRSILNSQVAVLEDALEVIETALSVDFAAHTSEVRFTDRVFKFHRRFANQFRENPVPGPNTDLLYEMLTGDFGDPTFLPLRAVRWHTSPTDIAIRVTENETDGFEAEIYNFSDSTRRIEATLYRLSDRPHRWELTGVRNQPQEGRPTAADGAQTCSAEHPGERAGTPDRLSAVS